MTKTHLWHWQFGSADSPDTAALEKTQVSFGDIPGWCDDQHLAAYTAYQRSKKHIKNLSGTSAYAQSPLGYAGQEADDEARIFFETNFTPFLVSRPSSGALVTGYFEPELEGSLDPQGAFQTPVHALPDDLIPLTDESARKTLPSDLTAARQTSGGLAPYYTRQEIEQGALSGRGLEIAFLADPYDAYVMQIQGSGVIRLPDGRSMRVGFSGKNGHPYMSIGKLLIERGALDPASAALDDVLGWMRANADEARLLMWQNRSYPFFRKLDDHEAADGPHGSMGIPLTAGRSLAVDPRYHTLGLPIWVRAQSLPDDAGKIFNRLMIAQDTGSAIRGPVRGDIFWGTGAEAGRFAGNTKDICDFYILIPN